MSKTDLGRNEILDIKDMVANPKNFSNSTKKAVLVISSQVVRGWVGGRASVFVLERNGFPVWFLPTVLLPWHPGHGPATKSSVSSPTFSKMVDELKNSKWFNEIGGILTGYMGSEDQVEVIENLIQFAKQKIPDVKYLCDPILGDVKENNGSLYISSEIAAAIRDRLVPLADLITPNLFELSFLADLTFDPKLDCFAAFEKLDVPEAFVTSVPSSLRESIKNLLINKHGSFAAEHERFKQVPHGTGDLLAALTLSRVLDGMNSEKLVQSVSASVYEVICKSLHNHADELLLVNSQDALINQHP